MQFYLAVEDEGKVVPAVVAEHGAQVVDCRVHHWVLMFALQASNASKPCKQAGKLKDNLHFGSVQQFCMIKKETLLSFNLTLVLYVDSPTRAHEMEHSCAYLVATIILRRTTDCQANLVSECRAQSCL